MKKRSKQIFGFLGILATLGILTSCNSFCSVEDSAAYRYAYDPVNAIFFESEDDAADYLLNSLSKENQTVYFKSNNDVVSLESLKNYNLKIFNENSEVVTTKLIDNASIFTNEYTSSLSSSSNADFSQIYFIRTTTIETYTLNENEEKTEYTFKVSKNSYVQSVETSSNSSGFNRPADQYWTDLDSKVISYISKRAKEDQFYSDKTYSSAFELLYGYTSKAYADYEANQTNENLQIMLNGGEYVFADGTSETLLGRNNSLLTRYGKYKYLEPETEDGLNMAEGNYWTNMENWNYEIKTLRNISGYTMEDDFFSLYKTNLDKGRED